MFRLNGIKTETYKYNDNYYIDIVHYVHVDWPELETYEAWIYRHDYGIKMLMYGMPATQQSDLTFLRTATANADEYIKLYEEKYCD